MDGILQLVTVFFIFLFVLVITYFTTRFIARQQQGQMFNKNIQVIETFKVTQNKYIQIVRTGGKYLAIAVCKDTITMLTELDPDEVQEITETQNKGMQDSFHELFEKAKKNVLKK